MKVLTVTIQQGNELSRNLVKNRLTKFEMIGIGAMDTVQPEREWQQSEGIVIGLLQSRLLEQEIRATIHVGSSNFSVCKRFSKNGSKHIILDTFQMFFIMLLPMLMCKRSRLTQKLGRSRTAFHALIVGQNNIYWNRRSHGPCSTINTLKKCKPSTQGLCLIHVGSCTSTCIFQDWTYHVQLKMFAIVVFGLRSSSNAMMCQKMSTNGYFCKNQLILMLPSPTVEQCPCL